MLLADSGTRAIARVDLATRQRTVIADAYQGKRFNSPNDLVLARKGDIYCTDPPFGLTGVQASPDRELTYTGVFRLTPDNQVHLVADNLFPNGIALSPNHRILYVTDNSGWVAIDLDASGMPTGQRPFVSSESVGGARGDGMKADAGAPPQGGAPAAGQRRLHLGRHAERPRPLQPGRVPELRSCQWPGHRSGHRSDHAEQRHDLDRQFEA